MLEERFRKKAEAEYFSNAFQFIGTGEEKSVSALDVLHIKQKHQAFQGWSAGLRSAFLRTSRLSWSSRDGLQ